MSELIKYDIVPITAEDEQVVIAFLRTFFFRDEPLILGIDMLDDSDSLAKLENYCFNFVNNGELDYKLFLVKQKTYWFIICVFYLCFH